MARAFGKELVRSSALTPLWATHPLAANFAVDRGQGPAFAVPAMGPSKILYLNPVVPDSQLPPVTLEQSVHSPPVYPVAWTKSLHSDLKTQACK